MTPLHHTPRRASVLAVLIPLGWLGMVGCGESKSACDAGFGLAADGKCYPIYDPFNPPWPSASTDSGSGSSGGSGSTGGTSGGGDPGGGTSGGGDPGGGDPGGGGTAEPPRVEGTYGIAADAAITSGSEIWIAGWTVPITDDTLSEPPIGQGYYEIIAVGDTSGFQIDLTAVPPDGVDVYVVAVLVQDDGDVTDDPRVVWSGNPGFVTPVEPLTSVELIIE